MPLYRFADGLVDSEHPLPGLAAVSASPQTATIRVQWSEDPSPDLPAPSYRWTGRYGLSLHETSAGPAWRFIDGSAMRWAANSRQLEVHLATPDSFPLVADGLVRRILPRLAVVDGALVLHAAAVAAPTGGILLCGTSGCGKSTLAAGLAGAGWPLLSDDFAVVEMRQWPPRCLPAAAAVCVWHDVTEALASQSIESKPMAGYKSKYWHITRASDVPCSLTAIWHLDGLPSGDVEVVRLTPYNLIDCLWRHIVHFNPGDRLARRVLGHRLMRLSEIPLFRVRYPRNLAKLEHVASTLTHVTSP